MTRQSRTSRLRSFERHARRYVLELSESQAEFVSRAVELYARLGLGQFPMLDRFFSWKGKQSEVERALPLLQELAVIKNGDPHSHPGIYSKAISDDYRVCFDLYQVVRHRLAWDREPNSQSWLNVDFSDPLRASTSEELARITRIETDKTKDSSAAKKAPRA